MSLTVCGARPTSVAGQRQDRRSRLDVPDPTPAGRQLRVRDRGVGLQQRNSRTPVSRLLVKPDNRSLWHACAFVARSGSRVTIVIRDSRSLEFTLYTAHLSEAHRTGPVRRHFSLFV